MRSQRIATKKYKIHLWVPDLLASRGGIQTYSLFLLAALQAARPYTPLRVFIKNETYPSTNEDKSITAPTLTCTGRGPRFVRTINFATQAFWWCQRERPDLIITTHLHFSPLARYLKRCFGTPYWTIAHGIDAWDVKSHSLRGALQNANLVLAVSGFTRDRLLNEQQLDKRRVGILPNTLDSVNYRISPKPAYLLARHNLRADQPVLLTVARLDSHERYKGYDTIIRALPKIRKVLPKVHYLLVGKGKDRTRIEELVRSLDLTSNVTLVGYVPDEELCDYYNLCDVFAMPSKKEGFGIVFLEALACGKPVLAGNQDGSVDALCHGKLGVLVDPDKVDEIADALVKMLQREYAHPLIYNPQALRQSVLDIYGFDQFKETVATFLERGTAEVTVSSRAFVAGKVE